MSEELKKKSKKESKGIKKSSRLGSKNEGSKLKVDSKEGKGSPSSVKRKKKNSKEASKALGEEL